MIRVKIVQEIQYCLPVRCFTAAAGTNPEAGSGSVIASTNPEAGTASTMPNATSQSSPVSTSSSTAAVGDTNPTNSGSSTATGAGAIVWGMDSQTGDYSQADNMTASQEIPLAASLGAKVFGTDDFSQQTIDTANQYGIQLAGMVNGEPNSVIYPTTAAAYAAGKAAGQAFMQSTNSANLAFVQIGNEADRFSGITTDGDRADASSYTTPLAQQDIAWVGGANAAILADDPNATTDVNFSTGGQGFPQAVMNAGYKFTEAAAHIYTWGTSVASDEQGGATSADVESAIQAAAAITPNSVGITEFNGQMDQTEIRRPKRRS